jgi:hypothetical protein
MLILPGTSCDLHKIVMRLNVVHMGLMRFNVSNGTWKSQTGTRLQCS